MKTTFPLATAIIVAVSSIALAADEPAKCCEKPKPEPAASGCCCMKMQKVATTESKTSLDQLLAKAKDAKDDQLLDALAAVLNKLIDERKAAKSGAAPAAAPEAHQH